MKRADLFKRLKKIDPKILLILIVLFGIFLRLLFFHTNESPDGFTYVNTAYSIWQGEYQLSRINYDPCTRLGMLLPMAFFMRLFGASEFIYALWPLICSIGTIILVYYFGKLLYNEKIGLWAAFLISFFPFEVFHSSSVLPDIPVSFFLGLSVYFFIKAERMKNIRREYTYYYLSGLFLAVAHLIKVVAVLLFLFFIVYIIWKKKIKYAYLFFFLGYFTLIIPFYIYFLVQKGNLLWQFSHYTGLAVYGYGETFKLPGSGGSFPFSMFMYPYYFFISIHKMGFFYYFITFAIVYLLMKKEKKSYLLLIWAGVLFAYLTFGFAKIDPLVMLHKEQRFLSIITIPSILLLAVFFNKKSKIVKYFKSYGLIFLLITSVFFMWFSSQIEGSIYRNTKDTAKFVLETDGNFYGDNLTISRLNFFSGYKTKDKVRSYLYYNFTQRKTYYLADLGSINNSYIIIDWGEINYWKKRGGQIRYPAVIYNPPENWELIKIYNSSLDKKFLFVLNLGQKMISNYVPSPISDKLLHSIDEAIEPKPVMIYYIP